ncbi:MAG: hypothetical protein WA945_04060 [Arcobacteraceae bacterium]
MSEFTQIDDLTESDILEALGVQSSINPQSKEQSSEDKEKDEDEIKIEDLDEEQVIIEDIEDTKEEKKAIQTTINSDELVSILGQLLHNKTLEITIKIKD